MKRHRKGIERADGCHFCGGEGRAPNPVAARPARFGYDLESRRKPGDKVQTGRVSTNVPLLTPRDTRKRRWLGSLQEHRCKDGARMQEGIKRASRRCLQGSGTMDGRRWAARCRRRERSRHHRADGSPRLSRGMVCLRLPTSGRRTGSHFDPLDRIASGTR